MGRLEQWEQATISCTRRVVGLVVVLVVLVLVTLLLTVHRPKSVVQTFLPPSPIPGGQVDNNERHL